MVGMKKESPGVSPLIAVDKNSRQPLYRQLYDAYRKQILCGNIAAGQRVPSTRALAVELRISRIPVLSAYEQLIAEGYFESRVGFGTVISPRLAVGTSAGKQPVKPTTRAKRAPRIFTAVAGEALSP